MTKSNKTTVITLVVMAVIAATVFFGYYQMTSKSKEEEMPVAKTEVDKLLQKDMENNYPGTPREVMRFHGRITQCIYNEDLKKNQLEGLLKQARELYDEELLALNPWDKHLETLIADIEDYKENERVIMSYTAQNSSLIKTHEVRQKTYRACGYSRHFRYCLFHSCRAGSTAHSCYCVLFHYISSLLFHNFLHVFCHLITFILHQILVLLSQTLIPPQTYAVLIPLIKALTHTDLPHYFLFRLRLVQKYQFPFAYLRPKGFLHQLRS